jgi:uncharacterized membrane protein (UPF0127 family)
MRRKLIRPLAALLVIFVLLGAYTAVRQERGNGLLTARLAGKTVKFEVADDNAERERGLSGRDGMPEDQGMLFIFEQPSTACFWMKDMRFDLDILWFDEGGKLVYQRHNLSPQTYPESYCPPALAKYVVELTAGSAGRLGVGDDSRLELPKNR